MTHIHLVFPWLEVQISSHSLTVDKVIQHSIMALWCIVHSYMATLLSSCSSVGASDIPKRLLL